jgi:Pentapeptide repeats (8 copies)
VRVDAVVDAVLGMLLNERDRRNELRVDYGDWSGEEYVARWFPFWMVKEHEPPGGGKVFVISEQTVNLYLNAFDMDLADHQAFIEGLTRSQLARGRIDKAAASAEQALLVSRAYALSIDRMLVATQRDVRRVDWAGAVPAEHTGEQLEVTRQQVQVSDRQAREQLEVARQGQVTERFTRAIDQLGQRGEDPLDRLDVRLGGIYALERIARDSEVDRPAIAEILTAYIRTHSPRPLTPGQPSADLTRDQVRGLPDLRTRAPDVQAALTVLSRGRFAALAIVGHGRLDLRAADLRNANLHGASLEWADLSDAHLEGALLAGARLEGADLRHARLEGAHLAGARLKRANLADAHLEGADLGGADLKEALYLDKAHLAGAEATDDPRHPTRWPDGFDWRAAGVDVVYTVELEDERQAGGEVPRGRRSGTDQTATPRAAGDRRRPRR